jgi:antitoxin YefM
MKIVPLTEARSRLSDLLDDVEDRHEHVVITRKGRPVAVLMSTDEWEAVEETLDVLADPKTMQALEESDEDVRAERVFSLDEVKRQLRRA